MEFHGAFSPEDIPKDLDLAVFPSICVESYSFTVDEALSRGIPVIVPSIGAPSTRPKWPGGTLESGDAW